MLKRRTHAFVVVLLLGLTACSHGPQTPLVSLGLRADALQAEFNRDAGKVRLLMLLDPT